MSDIRQRTHCSLCKRSFSDEEIELKVKLKGLRVKAALRNAKRLGEPVGRPRSADYERIKSMSRQGFTRKEISKILKVSLGTISRGMK